MGAVIMLGTLFGLIVLIFAAGGGAAIRPRSPSELKGRDQ